MNQKDPQPTEDEATKEPVPSEPTSEPTPPLPTQDTADQIRRLTELKESGVISEEDFEEQKRDLESRT